MIKRISYIFFAVLFFHDSFSQDTAYIVANSEIIKASKIALINANTDAKVFISNIDNANTLFERFVLVGPKLWNKIKDIAEFKNIKEGNLTIKIPKFEKDNSWKSKINLTGKIIQTPEDYNHLWLYLQKTFLIDKASIVDMDLTDKFIYWQYFGNIEETPKVIVKENTRIILHFVDKEKLYFIELSAE